MMWKEQVQMKDDESTGIGRGGGVGGRQVHLKWRGTRTAGAGAAGARSKTND